MLRFVIAMLAFLTGCAEQKKAVPPPELTQGGTGNAAILSPLPSIQELFRPLLDPNAIDGQEVRLLRCPTGAASELFLKSLWIEYRRDIADSQRRNDPSISAKRMEARLAAIGCNSHQGIVRVRRIRNWAALDDKNYVNWDRWIAFDSIPETSYVYLVWSPSVD